MSPSSWWSLSSLFFNSTVFALLSYLNIKFTAWELSTIWMVLSNTFQRSLLGCLSLFSVFQEPLLLSFWYHPAHLISSKELDALISPSLGFCWWFRILFAPTLKPCVSGRFRSFSRWTRTAFRRFAFLWHLKIRSRTPTLASRQVAHFIWLGPILSAHLFFSLLTECRYWCDLSFSLAHRLLEVSSFAHL